jgi:transcription elongation factor Elf1
MEAKGGRPGSRRPYVSFEVPATITVDAMTTSDSERAPQADWLMLGDAVDDLLAGLGDADGFRAAFGALRQAASSIDHQALLNTPQLPGDAGEYRRRLAVMLARIPDGWGRWISCSRGWYPIICELDEQLARLFLAYRIHQVKEKYAGLRYYWEAGEQLTDPADPEPEPPAAAAAAEDEDDTGWSERWDRWRRRQDEYAQTPEGQARAEDARLRRELADRLVDAAEARASVTCELCGQEGSMRCTCAPSAWYQTLCDACAAKRGMVTVAERNAWWEAEQPRFEARQRAQFIDDNAGRSAVVVGTPEQFQASLEDVRYLSSEDAVRQAAAQDPDIVFLADGPLAHVYARAFRDRHADHEARIAAELAAAAAARKPYAYPRPNGCPEMHKVGELPREVHENLSALGVTYRWSGSAVNAGPELRD